MKSFQQYVDESSLSRIHEKISNHSCGAITAFRNEFTKSQNMNRNKEILAALKVKGYSVTKVKGSYIENFQSDDAKEVGEDSWFVVNHQIFGDDSGQLENDLKKLGEKYDQDSILSVRGGKGVLIGTSKRDNAFPNYGQKVEVGTGKYGKVSGEFFSRVKGRQFAFESIEPDTIMGKWAMKALGNSIWE